MNHNIHVEKYGIKLRPVSLTDAQFIYDLRQTPSLNRYIGSFHPDFAVHSAWLEQYMKRENDYYFMITLHDGEPIGTIAIYDIDGQTGNWGRWIIKRPYPAAPASAWLIYHVAFDILQLPEVFANTVLANQQTVSFHDSCGLTRTRIEHAALAIDGIKHDVIIHTAQRHQWDRIQKKIEAPAKLAERFLSSEQ